MKVKLYHGLLLVLIAGFLTSCFSVRKELDRGNNDAVIAHSVKKLTGKKKKSPKHVKVLETALQRANSKDIQTIGQLENSPSIKDKDVRILRLYEGIQRRQDRISPLLPLIDKRGYEARFQFIKTLGKEAEYKERAVEFLYGNSAILLEKGEKGDKTAAREAYDQLAEIDRMVGDYKNIREMMRAAREYGTLYIEVNPFLGENVIMNKNVADVFLNFSYPEIHQGWKVVHYKPEKNRKYDLRVDFVLESFHVSPEREMSREYEDKKVIKPEPKKDDKGNEIPDRNNREVTVTAKVFEMRQLKEAAVIGRVFIVDLKTNRQVYSQNYTASEAFENYASTFQGDKRALSDVSLKRIGGRPLPFPSNEAMLLNGTENLKRELISLMRRWYDNY